MNQSRPALATTEPAAPTPIRTGAPKSARTITVLSKLPMSIELQLCVPRLAKHTGQYGSTEETVFVPTGAIYIIRGTSYPVGGVPKGYPKPPKRTGIDDDGYAQTPGVPSDWWDEWLRQNATTDMVRSGCIKAHHDPDDLDAVVAEHIGLMTGLEPLQLEGDPRSPKPLTTSLAEVKKDDRRQAAS